MRDNGGGVDKVRERDAVGFSADESPCWAVALVEGMARLPAGRFAFFGAVDLNSKSASRPFWAVEEVRLPV